MDRSGLDFYELPSGRTLWSPRLQRQHPQEALLHRSEREHGGVRYVEIIVSNNGEAATELPQRERSRHPRPRVRQSREPKSGLFGVDVPNHARRRALRELPAGGRATAAPAGLRPIHCHFTWNLHQQGV